MANEGCTFAYMRASLFNTKWTQIWFVTHPFDTDFIIEIITIMVITKYMDYKNNQIYLVEH